MSVPPVKRPRHERAFALQEELEFLEGIVSTAETRTESLEGTVQDQQILVSQKTRRHAQYHKTPIVETARIDESPAPSPPQSGIFVSRREEAYAIILSLHPVTNRLQQKGSEHLKRLGLAAEGYGSVGEETEGEAQDEGRDEVGYHGDSEGSVLAEIKGRRLRSRGLRKIRSDPTSSGSSGEDTPKDDFPQLNPVYNRREGVSKKRMTPEIIEISSDTAISQSSSAPDLEGSSDMEVLHVHAPTLAPTYEDSEYADATPNYGSTGLEPDIISNQIEGRDKSEGTIQVNTEGTNRLPSPHFSMSCSISSGKDHDRWTRVTSPGAVPEGTHLELDPQKDSQDTFRELLWAEHEDNITGDEVRGDIDEESHDKQDGQHESAIEPEGLSRTAAEALPTKDYFELGDNRVQIQSNAIAGHSARSRSGSVRRLDDDVANRSDHNHTPVQCQSPSDQLMPKPSVDFIHEMVCEKLLSTAKDYGRKRQQPVRMDAMYWDQERAIWVELASLPAEIADTLVRRFCETHLNTEKKARLYASLTRNSVDRARKDYCLGFTLIAGQKGSMGWADGDKKAACDTCLRAKRPCVWFVDHEDAKVTLGFVPLSSRLREGATPDQSSHWFRGK